MLTLHEHPHIAFGLRLGISSFNPKYHPSHLSRKRHSPRRRSARMCLRLLGRQDLDPLQICPFCVMLCYKSSDHFNIPHADMAPTLSNCEQHGLPRLSSIPRHRLINRDRPQRPHRLPSAATACCLPVVASFHSFPARSFLPISHSVPAKLATTMYRECSSEMALASVSASVSVRFPPATSLALNNPAPRGSNHCLLGSRRRERRRTPLPLGRVALGAPIPLPGPAFCHIVGAR